MSLCDLPSELLYAISYRIPPDTIEAYGCTCHRIRNIAAPLIKEHRQLRAEYTKSTLNNATAAHTLYAICARPWIRLYPKSLEVMANKRQRSLDNPRTAKQRAIAQAIMLKKQSVRDAITRELMGDTGLIETYEMDTWIQQIDKGDEDYLFALLIALLPNLHCLRISLDCEKLEQVKEVLRRIKRQTGSSRALSILKTVHILEKDGSDSGDLEMFPLAAALPGVERMHGRNLVGMYRDCYRDGWMSYPGASPASPTYLSRRAVCPWQGWRL